MKIVYLGYYQSGIALLTASFYLGFWQEKDDLNDQLETLIFTELSTEEKGKFISLGQDSLGNEVLVLGCQGQQAIVSRMLKGLTNMFTIDNELLIVDTTSVANLWIKVGVKLTRVGWNKTGLYLIKRGVKNNYLEIKQLTTKLKERINS
ncbi:Protein of unknown function (DUF3189) [Halobacteroides halobius DSM 5150]|uniref:DUF3189 domain-containing protein n=1 Tax=Halobacteroides halobius (strain ATCC 35273 / DSM 5150 / MD-1) TaxID=748449 RepID=L0KBR6_HALHC|nr:DUF3189 family protein [Halobacteroides halobius]AGB41533.1 Protein of unknown function (DUF3189) [Halobacteroides halobius DSM 5150]